MKICLLLCIACFSCSLWAQSLVSGRLVEKGTRKPLAGVNIYILPQKWKVETDSEGNFQFAEVPEGEFEFVVNNPGYIRLTVKPIQPLNDTRLYLEKENYGVFETTVTGLADKRDVTRKGMTQEEFMATPGAQDDPVKAIQNLPGIASQPVSSQVIIQGSAPDDTRYTLNGHEIPLVFHFGGLSSVVMPQAVESVDYLAGGYGPEYGRALGGIINLKTRPPKKDRWHGLGFVDTYNAGLLFEGPIDDKSSVFIGGRYSYIGQVLNAVAGDSDNFALTVAPTFSDVFMDYRRQLSPRDEFSFVYIRTNDELSFVLNEPPNGDVNLRGAFYQNTKFYRMIPRWRRQINDRASLDLSVGYGDNDILFEIGEDNYFDLNSSTLSTRFELENKFSENYTGYLGVDTQKLNFNVRLRAPNADRESGSPNGDITIVDLRDENWESAFYLRNRIQLADQKLTLSPNLRFTHFSVTDEFFVEPRLAMQWKASETLSYSLATGLYYQAPQNGEATVGFGNPDLKSEEALHVSLGIEKDFRGGRSNGIVYTGEVFYKDLQNLIVPTSAVDSAGNPVANANDGTGQIYGLQSQLKWFWRDFNFVAAYTFLDSRRTDPRRGTYPSEFDQTHNLNLISSYKLRRWVFSTRLRYVTGQPFTPATGGIYDNDNDSYIPINGSFFSQRLRDFFQWDIRFDRKFVFQSWILSAYLDIQNVTNQANVLALNYNYDYSASTETMALPLFPIFGVKGEF